jgi:hypothetical protein
MAAPNAGPPGAQFDALHAVIMGRLDDLQADVQQLQAGQQQLQAGQQQLQADVQQIQAGQQQVQAGLQQLQAALHGVPAAIANINALLAGVEAPPPGAPALARTRWRIALARSSNHHERNDVFVPVPRADGAMPAHWPLTFNRTILRNWGAAQLQALLGD